MASESAASDAEAFDKGAGELVAAVLYADHELEDVLNA